LVAEEAMVVDLVAEAAALVDLAVEAVAAVAQAAIGNQMRSKTQSNKLS
jgi:hypothetical protein